MEKSEWKNQKAAIDALRLYEGDTYIRDESGKLLRRQSTDSLYGDKDAYRTLNALLFPGISNEVSRIKEEGKKLNPVFLERIEETIELYCHIFRLMSQKHIVWEEKEIIAKRVERQSTLSLLEQGRTLSFVSASKSTYNKEFAKKNGVILLEVHLTCDVPYLDLEKTLGAEYKNIEEREILLAPFVDIEIKKVNMTLAEQRNLKDINGKPPVGKYQITALKIQDFREIDNPAFSLEEIKESILHKKEVPLAAVTAMNHGQWDKDFSEYIHWKEELQNYLKYKLSDMWYRGDEIYDTEGIGDEEI